MTCRSLLGQNLQNTVQATAHRIIPELEKTYHKRCIFFFLRLHMSSHWVCRGCQNQNGDGSGKREICQARSSHSLKNKKLILAT